MRTEVKVGLIAGLFVIGGVAIYLFNKGGAQQPPDHIPWPVNPDQARKDAQPATGRDLAKSGKTATTPPGKPAEPKTDLTRRTLPPPTTRPAGATPPLATSQPTTPPLPRRTLPPLTTQRTVIPPAPEARTPAAPDVAKSETPSPRREVVTPETPTTKPTGDSEKPLTIGPIETEPVTPPSPPERLSPLSGAEPAPAPVLPPSPGVALPPRRADVSRAEDTSTRVRDAARPKPEPTRYTVQESDTLTYLARQQYGDGKYWTKIRDANPGINADHLLVGQVLLIPPKDEVTGVKPAATPSGKEASAAEASKTDNKPTTRPAAKTYVVTSGDTLTSIARSLLGDGSRWREIYDLNKDKIKNPDNLLEGAELKIPANGPKPAPTATTRLATTPKPAAPAATAKPAAPATPKPAPASPPKKPAPPRPNP